MNEFLDIYRLYAKNYHLDRFEHEWAKEDVEKMLKLLDEIGTKIDNGKIIINTLRREIVEYNSTDNLVTTLLHVRDTLFEMESTIYSKEQKSDQLIEKEKPKSLLKFVKEKQKENDTKPERNKNGDWKKIIEQEEPLKKYGTISISPSIKGYIWSNLPVDFGNKDVIDLFKKFYEEKLNRILKESSYRTYASRYICYFKEHIPPMISWKDFYYSKDLGKYKEKTIEKIGIKKKNYYKRPHDEKDKRMGKIKRWTPDEDAVIRRYQPTENVDSYMRLLPGRTRYAIEKRARAIKVFKVTDSNQARKNLLEIGKEDNKDESESVETLIENEMNKPFLTEKTKTMLEENNEPKSIKTAINNPFYDGSAEHHLYQIAVKSNWFGFKKGTPMIMINRQMSEFPKEQVKDAIDMLVKRKKALRLPNNFVAFYQ